MEAKSDLQCKESYNLSSRAGLQLTRTFSRICGECGAPTVLISRTDLEIASFIDGHELK